METQIHKRLVAIGTEGLDTGVFCGISAGISVRQNDVRIRAWFSGGRTRIDDQGSPVEHATLFDLASLTKPLCTVLCALYLISQGKLSWDDQLGGSYPADKQSIKVHHLLQHASGLPAYQPYFQSFQAEQSINNKKHLLDRILQEPLEYPTGACSVYSDLGFILLGDRIEQRSGMPLEHLFTTRISEPLCVEKQVLFLPVGRDLHGHEKKVAATEDCGWRKSILQGEVHDEHCWLMGGVAGHAGLFGTVEGVMTLCECLLDIWKGRTTHPAFRSELLCHALNYPHPHSSWCLGFDTPTPGASSSGRYFSPRSVGHLGFSGTSFWIDPEQETVVVLLTNRIHPSRENRKIRSYRPYFHDYLMELL